MPVIEGEHDGKIVAVAIGGLGRAAARRAAGLLIAGHRPRWIISAGFAGALNPALNRNDLVLPEEVIDPRAVDSRSSGRTRSVPASSTPRAGSSRSTGSSSTRPRRRSCTATTRPTWSTWNPRRSPPSATSGSSGSSPSG